MKGRKKICMVTSSRADYGLLYWVMREIDKDIEFQLQVIATGMHLSPEFGLTYKAIEEDGFYIDYKVEMLLSSDTPVGVAKSMGLGVIGFAEAFNVLNPDLIVLLGDRYETLSAAQAALVTKVPIAHLSGGDTTEGAFDEAIRHSITKMSHLHFVTNEQSAQRVRQLGENPEHVFAVGSPGLDYIRKANLFSRTEVEKVLGFEFQEKNFLITFHPVTLEDNCSIHHLHVLFKALSSFEGVGLIFTMPNADPEGRSFIQDIERFVGNHPKAKAFTSMGQILYLSTMSLVDVVIGNSSSGLLEAPSFQIPTVNIGDRQKGRLRASSVIDCEPETNSVINAINEALVKDCSKTNNPYGDGHSSEKIIAILKSFSEYRSLLKKHFFLMEPTK